MFVILMIGTIIRNRYRLHKVNANIETKKTDKNLE